MSIQSATGTRPGGHRPSPILLPPIYQWPLRFKACAVWIWHELVFPYGIFYLVLAVATWHFLTPEPAQMATFKPGWMLMIWLRNAMLISIVAGGLHWWLYIKRRQVQAFKFDRRWPATNSRAFLWGDQVKDNIFWSVASGSLLWSLYEALTLWWYASGQIQPVAWSDAPLYLTAMCSSSFSGAPFTSTGPTACCIGRRFIESRSHHRNVNTGPWSGISMHPIEHLIYFSPVLLWWVVPADPVIIIATGFYLRLRIRASAHRQFH